MSTAPEAASAAALLQVITELALETRPPAPPSAPLHLDSRLERDLGFDSLTRAELLQRIERAFHLSLPQQALTAETPRELLRDLLAAHGMPAADPGSVASIHESGAQAPTAQALPRHATTLIQVLTWHAHHNPDRTAIHLYGDTEQSESISYGALQRDARALAAGLRERGLEPGQSVAIMLPTGHDYFASFFGILLAGGVPVPIYPPLRPSQIEEHLRRHARILTSARSVVLITVPEAATVAHWLRAQVETLRHVATVPELSHAIATAIDHNAQPTDIAFLQYTSGSTGDPKGVMLSHANLLANIRAMGNRIALNASDVFVSWLPLYHDMGLIGAWLGSLYHGIPLAVMSPLRFLRQPSSWLWAIHRHRGTLSAAPNFAYELCLRNVQDDAIKGLDLSSWRFAFNGAEPVSATTMRRFAERFHPYGFDSAALAPVYGLAECSVGLALPAPGRGLKVERISRSRFMSSGQAVPATAAEPDALEAVACGHALPGHQIRVVDEAGRELPERREGLLQFQGPSATIGYLRNPEASAQLFAGPWLNSGDRAFIVAGDVYLTGRMKDMIIRGGRNFYPYELELAVGDIAGVRKGCVAVFASRKADGGEQLVVVAETRERAPAALQALQARIRDAALDVLGMAPDDVVLAPPHSVLKTSSGKIRRSAVRDLYERKALGSERALWRQIAGLALASTQPALRKFWRHLREALFAGLAWLVFGACALIVGLLALLPWPHARWSGSRTAGRWALRLLRIHLQIDGLQRLPNASPCVLVANHASYLDSLILIIALPRRLRFIAKRELADIAWLRFLLERFGTLFVERFDPHRSAADGARAAAAARAGDSLVFFPEGTFGRTPGLLPFRMGAFVAAAQAQVLVVPVTLRGTRSMLRADSWFPRREMLRVIVGESVQPTGADWGAAIALRDCARATILRYCGEPDLSAEDSPLFNKTEV
ncbi:MAG: AMP-binding protein [Gammaproteobacteria bacterium]